MPSEYSYFTLVEQLVECVITMYAYLSRLLDQPLLCSIWYTAPNMLG